MESNNKFKCPNCGREGKCSVSHKYTDDLYENIDFSDNEEVNNYNYDSMSVYDVWEDLRYDVDYIDDSWYICGFLGEKYGSDDELFNLIAPYCEDGYIQFCGEDGEHFRFVIKDGKFHEVHAKLN